MVEIELEKAELGDVITDLGAVLIIGVDGTCGEVENES